MYRMRSIGDDMVREKLPPNRLATGYLGMALASGHFHRCFPDSGWRQVAHSYLTAALAPGVPADIGHELFGGLAGIRFCAAYLSRGTGSYRKLIAAVDRTLIPRVRRLCAKVAAVSDGCPVSFFDIVSGLAGIGLAYLCDGDALAENATILEDITSALGALMSNQPGRPAWWTPIHQMHSRMQGEYPNGHLNLGVAHGLAGVLAFLALAVRSGIGTLALADTVLSIGVFVEESIVSDRWGINWPAVIALDRNPVPNGRATWCYGAPGVARALYLAGSVLKQPQMVETSRRALLAVEARSHENWHLITPTFCHGFAGLLQIAVRFHRDAGCGERLAVECIDQILQHYEPQATFGFRDVTPNGERLDRLDLLEGAVGVVLALLSVTSPVNPAWDRLFALT